MLQIITRFVIESLHGNNTKLGRFHWKILKPVMYVTAPMIFTVKPNFLLWQIGIFD